MARELRQVGAAAPEDLRIERYTEAERHFWSHSELEPKERFIELDSPTARLRVLEVGSGEAILFVHGTAGAGPVWAPIAKELEASAASSSIALDGASARRSITRRAITGPWSSMY